MSLNELGELIEYRGGRRGAREMDPVEGRFMSLLNEEKNNEEERAGMSREKLRSVIRLRKSALARPRVLFSFGSRSLRTKSIGCNTEEG